jgi:protein-tyrosine-phosphatase
VKTLFICQANIGRSQMAEAFYNFHTGTRDAISAGAEDFREKYFHRPTAEIINAMIEKGIDIAQQRIDFLDEKMIQDVDRVVVLCSKNFCPDFLLNSEKVLFREVQDPHEQSEASIRQIRDQIEKIVLELVEDGGSGGN